MKKLNINKKGFSALKDGSINYFTLESLLSFLDMLEYDVTIDVNVSKRKLKLRSDILK